jgi:hypothetical protein
MINPSQPVARDDSRWHRAMPDVLGVLYVAIAGVVLEVSALIHGVHLGPFDLLSQVGLTKKHGVVVHNTWVGDQIDAVIPWTTLAWTQVHHGQLPLWNPYGGLGMPLAFNWQSAPFGLPAVVGYLVPVQYAYTVGIVVTVIVAGTGGYVLGRVLGLGVLGCAMAGTVVELSGPFVAWLGWPHAAVFSWAGWLFAAAILIVRGKHRVKAVAFFAVVLALAVYAGQPEIVIVLIFSLAVFLFVLLAQHAWRRRVWSILRPIGDLAIASVAGAALAAPLALPGFQLFAGSVHSKSPGETVLPAENLIHLIVQGFDGLPVAGSRMFGSDGPYYVGAYVGVIAMVLAVVAVAVRRRPPEVIAFAATALVSAGIIFIPFMIAIMDDLPSAGSVGWARAQLPMAFAIAVLAGCGVDALVHTVRERVWKWSAIGFAVAGIALILLFFGSIGNLPAVEHRIRAESFIWPAVEVSVGFGLIGGFVLVHRRRHSDGEPAAKHRPHGEPPNRPVLGQWVGLLLLVCETAFLVSAGAPLWSSSSTFFAPTPAVTALQRDVGSSLVGRGPHTSLCLGLGIIANANDAFDVHELALYDPMVPKSYFTSFADLTGRSAGYPANNEYCPALTSVSQARRYGVAYILESTGVPGPSGTTFVTRLGDEELYHVPQSFPATLTPLLADGSLPANGALGVPVAVTHPNPASWKTVTASTAPQVLRLRLSDVSGWHASIDGKTLSLKAFSGTTLQARIPPGRHVVELNYWPAQFTLGIVLGACSFIGLVIALVVDSIRQRPRQHAQPRR